MPILQIIAAILAYVVTAAVLALAVAFFGGICIVAWLDWRSGRAFEAELKKMPKWEKRL